MRNLTFSEKVKLTAESAVLRLISEGHWIAPDYANRFKIPSDMLSDIWAMVDVESIKKKMAERIEAELADRIVNHLAREISTDIKQILSVPERREVLRAVARAHMNTIMQADKLI